MHHLHLVIRGRVQGVGFRSFVLHRARAAGVAGTVRNRPDDAVEVEAEGERGPLGALLAAVREGPPAARIQSVDEDWREGPMRFTGFRIVE